MKNLLVHYANYNVWANQRMADRLVAIEPALLDKEVKSSFPTLRKTVLHIWDAETIWLNRIQGNSLTDWPSKSLPPDTPIDQFVETSQQFADHILKADKAALTATADYGNLKGKHFEQEVWQMIQHCMNHSTFHRGQLVTMLRELGITEILPTDLIYYLRFSD